jgi:hypothetical protein
MKAKLVSFFVLLIVFSSSYFIYHTWTDDLSNQSEIQVIEMNDSMFIQQLSSNFGKRLVPVGALMGENDVNELHFEYRIEVNHSQTLDVKVLETLILKDGNQTNQCGDLFTYSVTQETLNSNEILVSIRVQMNMPKNEMEYNIVSGSRVSFKLSFDRY